MLRPALLALVAAVLAAPAAAHAELSLTRVGTFDNPVEVVAPPADSDRVYVVEQQGTVRVVENGRALPAPFLDIRGSVQSGGERGLLSLAFDPQFAQNRRFYVYFTDNQGDIRIEQFSAQSPQRADHSSRRRVLEIGHRRFPNHNGGHLEFGPDGLLYASTGDGGGGGDTLGNGQNRRSLLGKLLRIDPRPGGGFGAPRSNLRGPIYAYGLRNPWRFSFDTNGDITIGDVGQGAVEEVNFLRRGRARGANFGWNVFEGRRRFRGGRARGHVPPVLQRFHAQGYCGVVGGVIVRDPALRSVLGDYVFGDLCVARLRAARLTRRGARRHRALPVAVAGLSSFGRDARNRVYAVSLNGPVYRLTER